MEFEGFVRPLWILGALLIGLIGVASLVPAVFAVMIVGGPGSASRLASVILALSIGTFPFVCFFAALFVFWSAIAEQYEHCPIILCCPLVNIASGGAALAWINSFQGGKFNG